MISTTCAISMWRKDKKYKYILIFSQMLHIKGWIESKGSFNIKMPSYQYRNSHYKDNVVLWPSYLFNGNGYTGKDGLFIERGPGFLLPSFLCSNSNCYLATTWESAQLTHCSLVIWWHKSWSTLAQVMACCLMAPSHYLNQCWLIISEVPWHLSEAIIIRRS